MTAVANNKKSIHFILPGGGVRGSFQAGFIYQLRKQYSDLFEIYQIDGTSVGALNGMAMLLNEPEHIKNLWFSIHSIETIFNPWAQKPIWGRLKTVYNSFYNKSVYQNDGLKQLVYNNFKNIDTNRLNKYNCVVTNIFTAEHEYKNGTNEFIQDYIIASASPWIIAPPMNIDNHLYVDGGLLQTYPIENIKQSKADIKLLLGLDSTHTNKIGMAGQNMITYLARLIDISRLNHPNIKKLNHTINKYNIITIENPLDYPFLEFTKERVIQGFDLGIEAANQFAEKYLY